MRLLGIDESGRGPVIGPMVVCGYLIEDANVAQLKQLGARDSKLLSPKRREALYPQLEAVAVDIAVVQISAADIDALRTVSNLNKLELQVMADLIDLFQPDTAIVDAPEMETRFAAKLAALMTAQPRLIAEHSADKRHLPVSAASIIAKVTRDRAVASLKNDYGEFGSGYPSDPATIAFLKNWIEVNTNFPPIVRKSWLTAQLMTEEKQQRSLRSFGASHEKVLR